MTQTPYDYMILLPREQYQNLRQNAIGNNSGGEGAAVTTDDVTDSQVNNIKVSNGGSVHIGSEKSPSNTDNANNNSSTNMPTSSTSSTNEPTPKSSTKKKKKRRNRRSQEEEEENVEVTNGSYHHTDGGGYSMNAKMKKARAAGGITTGIKRNLAEANLYEDYDTDILSSPKKRLNSRGLQTSGYANKTILQDLVRKRLAQLQGTADSPRNKRERRITPQLQTLERELMALNKYRNNRTGALSTEVNRQKERQIMHEMRNIQQVMQRDSTVAPSTHITSPPLQLTLPPQRGIKRAGDAIQAPPAQRRKRAAAQKRPADTPPEDRGGKRRNTRRRVSFGPVQIFGDDEDDEEEDFKILHPIASPPRGKKRKADIEDEEIAAAEKIIRRSGPSALRGDKRPWPINYAANAKKRRRMGQKRLHPFDDDDDDDNEKPHYGKIPVPANFIPRRRIMRAARTAGFKRRWNQDGDDEYIDERDLLFPPKMSATFY